MNSHLKEKILHDIANQAKIILTDQKISFSKDATDEELFLEYMNALEKRIPSQPRKVFFSKELQEKIDTKNIVEQISESKTSQEIIDLILNFKLLFEKGVDINNHLSIQIFSSKRQDLLFNTWNIKHIHLSLKEAKSKSAMKRNRSDYLLFCIVKEDSVYFLDVCRHPAGNEFSSYKFLKIAFNNNWMQLLGFVEPISNYVPNSIKPVITNDNDIYELYNNNFNLAFEFSGHAYIPLKTGISGSGAKITTVNRLFQLQRDINNLQLSEKDYIGYTPNNANTISGTITFNCNGEIHTYMFDFGESIEFL